METNSGFEPRTPEQQALLIRVAQAALAAPKALDMKNWHSCETSHCIAGWAIYLAGDERYPVAFDDNGTWDYYVGLNYVESVVGADLLGDEAESHFFDEGNDEAREWLKSVLLEAEEEIPSWVQDDGKETETEE